MKGKSKAKTQHPVHPEPKNAAQHPEEGVPGVAMLLYELALATGLLALVLIRPWLEGVPFRDALFLVLFAASFQGARHVFPGAPARGFELALANGAAAVLLARPWLDGITFTQYNIPFLWLSMILFGVWAAHHIVTGASLRWPLPLLMLALFLAVAGGSGLFTVDADNTLRGLMNWTAYAMLFTVCANGLRSRLGVGIVLAGFFCGFLAESVFSIWHLQYLLPITRRVVEQNPEIAQSYLGVEKMNATLNDRLGSNRAFGTFLFPNALAAYLVLGIPLALGALGSRIIKLRDACKPHHDDEVHGESPTAISARRGINEPAFMATAILGVSLLTAYIIFHFYSTQIRYADPSWRPTSLKLLFWVGAVPLLAAAISYSIAKAKGSHALWLVIQSAVLIAGTIYGSIALALTFSRGGMLGMALALILVSPLMIRFTPRRLSLGRRAATYLLLCGCAFGALAINEPSTSQPSTSPTSAEGQWLDADDLMKTNTFEMRTGYWRVGLRVFRDYPWAGVGLGNFGVVYPNYQTLAETPVKKAHNDYIQAFAEMGVVGGVLFTGLWLAFALWGGMRIWREETLEQRFLLGGLYAGVLAFALHAIVDFNFQNPALALPALALCGCFFAISGGAAPCASHQKIWRWLPLVPMIIAAAGAGWISTRARQVDLIMGDGAESAARVGAADYFLFACAPDRPDGTSEPIAYMAVQSLMGFREVVESFGMLMRPSLDSPQSGNPVPKDAPLNGYEILRVTDRPRAYQTARDAIALWKDRCVAADAIYPYSATLAFELYKWHDLEKAYERDPKAKSKAINGCCLWANKAVSRSPRQAQWHELLGDALWNSAADAPEPSQVAVYEQAIESCRTASILSPTRRESAEKLVSRLKALGQALKDRPGAPPQDIAKGDALLAEALTAQEHAKTLSKTE